MLYHGKWDHDLEMQLQEGHLQSIAQRIYYVDTRHKATSLRDLDYKLAWHENSFIQVFFMCFFFLSCSLGFFWHIQLLEILDDQDL